ncbi:hypothetical protein [Streptococcus oriscaviae]|uniref:Uncharacterized protein n=1 Tax=Streptococcus oriscaviae TaxID=2781599 RepID=A0ABX7YKI1_9STRE|nr:hypothetical protein [Streptococcus oriscaviae]QUE53972.1 hypothetical protein INT76_09085 [Streptococcus oriscaviae]
MKNTDLWGHLTIMMRKVSSPKSANHVIHVFKQKTVLVLLSDFAAVLSE